MNFWPYSQRTALSGSSMSAAFPNRARSAIQFRRPCPFAARTGSRVHAHEKSRRASPREKRFRKSRLAQRFLPRLRRLHGHRRISRGPGALAATGAREAHRHHVRRSRAVALPSLAHWRRAARSWRARRRHHERHLTPRTRIDPLREGRRPQRLLSRSNRASKVAALVRITFYAGKLL